jgi:hypothetical protein
MSSSLWPKEIVWHKNKVSWRATVPCMLGQYLRSLGTSKNKHVPWEIKNATKELIQCFLFSYVAGDGHIRSKAKKNNGIGRKSRNEITAATISGKLKDDLQELALKAGWCSSVRIQKAQCSTMRDGRIINCPDIWIICFKRVNRAEILPNHINRKNYKGKIYCLNVPYHTLYIRRKGKVSWNGNTPACIMAQMPPTGQLKVGYELCADRAGADRFSDEVLKYCSVNMPGDKWEYIDIGDPAGNTASQTDEKTCFQILRGKGIKIQPGHQGLEMRLESVRYPLHTMIDGNPGIIIDPRCKRLRKGFLGRYQYRRKITSREEYHEVPDKNDYSHIHDGLQYICSALFSNVLKGRVAKLSRQVERDSWPEREGIKNKTNKYTGY